MDTLFFILSKLVGALLRPDTWVVVAFGLILVTVVSQRATLAKWLSATAFVCVVLLSVFPFGGLLLQPIERHYPSAPELDRLDGIVVLGGGEDLRTSAYWGQVQLNAGAERYTAALVLAKRFPEARLVFAGGSGALRDVNGTPVSEAEIAERFFLEQGIDPERLELEGRSRNTAENAQLSYALAQPRAGEVWVLITSAFHMPRAMRSFETAGWSTLTAWPVDYRTSAFRDGIGWQLTNNLAVLQTAIREIVGALAYRLAQR